LLKEWTCLGSIFGDGQTSQWVAILYNLGFITCLRMNLAKVELHIPAVETQLSDLFWYK